MTITTRHALARLRSRARTGILVETAGAVAIALAVFAVASFALDRWLRLETGYRAALLLAAAAAVLHLVRARLLRPLRTVLSDDELALAVERHDPPLRQALISAVQFSRSLRGGEVLESPSMMRRVVDEVEARTRAIRFAGALDGRRVLRFGGALALVVAALAGWAAAAPETFGLWLRRNVLLAAVEWPRATLLGFVEPVQRVPQGDDVTVRVAARGVVPEEVTLHYAFAGGERGREPMTLTGENEFRFTLQALLEGVRLRATGGDGVTHDLHIAIVERPVLHDLRVAVDPPAYVAGAPAALAPAEGDLRVLRGSRVRLQARSSKPLRGAFLLDGDEARTELAVGADGSTLEGEFTPAQSGPVAIDVVDADRLGCKEPPRLYLRVADDQAPAVDFRLRGIGSMVTAVARIPGTMHARDDLALTAVGAEQRVTGGPTAANGPEPGEPGEPAASGREGQPPPEPEFAPLPLTGLEPFAAGERELTADVSIDLRALAIAAPGQLLAVRLRAADNFGPEAPHVGYSEVALFRIVTAEELAADLQRRQLEQRKLLEAVLKQQTDARARLAETLAPAASDPRAADARRLLVQLAKTERDLGTRVHGIGSAYAQILEEAENNRIADATASRVLRDGIVQPLSLLATERFPQAAVATEAFAAAGQDDLRGVALAVYDSIIAAIRTILARMAEEERLAAVVARLRELIKLETEIDEDARKRREAAGAEIFGPGRTNDSKDGSAPPPKKNRP